MFATRRSRPTILSKRTSLPPCTTVYSRCTPRPVSGHPPRSPVVADNVAAFPEPEEDRIAREVLNFKLSGAEGEQRYSISNPRCCTCVQQLVLFILYHSLLEYIRLPLYLTPSTYLCIVVPVPGFRLGVTAFNNAGVLTR